MAPSSHAGPEIFQLAYFLIFDAVHNATQVYGTVTFPIVMVDDDSDDRWLMDEAFKQIGAEQDIKKLMDGPGLIRYLEAVEEPALPRIIVLDISLPQMGVTEILSVIRSAERWKAIKVIVLLNSPTLEMPEYLKRYGADLCLQKPSSPAQLVELARRLKKLSDREEKGWVHQ